MVEWMKADTLKFIELWQGYECLWNTKSSDYRHRQKRNDALSQLAQQMSMDNAAIEKKIISLKTQFNREVNKLKIKSEGGLEAAQSTWYAFEYLLFLKDINIPRPSTDPLMVTQTENEQQEAELQEPCVSLYLLEENENKPESIALQQSQPRSVYKRKHDSQLGKINLLKNASIINKQKNDEFSIFGETIACELREIRSKRHLLMLKKEIMDVVYRTKLEMLDSENTD